MMVRDPSDYQDNSAGNTRAQPAGTSSKTEPGRVERSGNEDRGRAPEAAPRYIANKVTPPAASEAPASLYLQGEAPKNTPKNSLFKFDSDAVRLSRYERRQQSKEWLIRAARMSLGLSPVAAPGEGKRSTEPGWVRPPRPARCAWRIAEDVGVHHDGDVDLGAHWSGIERCASIWACPVCAAVIRAARTKEIQEAVDEWLKDPDHHLIMVTYTMRHRKSDRLDVTLPAALEAYQRNQAGSPWVRFREKYGIVGSVRAAEVTVGKNGWHPHIHALYFTTKPLDKDGQAAMHSWLFERWFKFVTKLGGGAPTKLRGVDIRVASDSGKVVAQYLSKLQDDSKEHRPLDKKVASELGRADFKEGRQGSLTPFELLDPAKRADWQDDEAAYHLWVEYVEAVKGRRAITWSGEIRELLNLARERSDEEIINDVERQDLKLLIPGKVYDSYKNQPAVLALILELVESGNLELAAQVAGADVVTDAPKEKPKLPRVPNPRVTAAQVRELDYMVLDSLLMEGKPVPKRLWYLIPDRMREAAGLPPVTPAA